MGCLGAIGLVTRGSRKSMKHFPSIGGAKGLEANTKQAVLAEHLSSTLSALVPTSRNVVFWDYPVYSNVGDIAIYLGTEAWLRQNSNRVLDRRSMLNFREVSLDPETVILLQGGGNFGDLYDHQTFRERVVSAYPDNRIVFLPQTLHYQNERARAASREILNSHADLHLILRDSRSYSVAGELFGDCHTHLAPDMTAALYPLKASLGLQLGDELDPAGELYLLRTDVEARNGIAPFHAEEGACDWEGMLGAARVSVIRQGGRMHRYGQLTPASLLAMGWYEISLRVLRHCARVMLGADRIVTDRLHGHILATMLGIPNVVRDNSYGKNRRYFETWHGDIDIARFADSDNGVVAGDPSQS